jgi:lipopolysaccharide export system permease protein
MGKKPRRGGHAKFRVIQAYVAREFLFGFFVCFLFFFAVFFVNQILLMAEDILSKKAPLREVLLLLLYAMPSVIAMSFPFASLVGALMAAGRLASDNEILALMAAGVPPRTAFSPFVVLGLLFSLASFAMNDYFLPLGTIEFGKLYRKLITSTPALELKPWSVKRYRDVSVITGEAQGAELDDLLIFDRSAEGRARVISASKARLESGSSGSDVVLRLEGIWSQTLKKDEPDRFEWAQASEMEYRISARDSNEDSVSVGPREMASPDLARVIAEKNAVLDARRTRRVEDILGARAAIFELYERDLEASLPWSNAAERLAPKLANLRSHGDAAPEDRTLQVYRLEYYKKFSIPFGALFFVALAFPLGLRARRAGRAVGFGLGILVSVIYWALLLGGQTVGTRLGWSPFWAMWLPNVFVLTAGILLWAARLVIR